MNNEDILRMAKQVGLHAEGLADDFLVTHCGYNITRFIKDFAALVQAATAEECAQLTPETLSTIHQCLEAECFRWRSDLTACVSDAGSIDRIKAVLAELYSAIEEVKAIRTKFQDQTTSGEKV